MNKMSVCVIRDANSGEKKEVMFGCYGVCSLIKETASADAAPNVIVAMGHMKRTIQIPKRHGRYVTLEGARYRICDVAANSIHARLDKAKDCALRAVTAWRATGHEYQDTIVYDFTSEVPMRLFPQEDEKGAPTHLSPQESTTKEEKEENREKNRAVDANGAYRAGCYLARGIAEGINASTSAFVNMAAQKDQRSVQKVDLYAVSVIRCKADADRVAPDTTIITLEKGRVSSAFGCFNIPNRLYDVCEAEKIQCRLEYVLETCVYMDLDEAMKSVEFWADVSRISYEHVWVYDFTTKERGEKRQ